MPVGLGKIRRYGYPPGPERIKEMFGNIGVPVGVERAVFPGGFVTGLLRIKHEKAVVMLRGDACLYGMCGYRPSFKMMPDAYRSRVMELAEIVGIQDSLFKPVKKLSGGMQRKLEIIRSLIHTPSILFLDEPRDVNAQEVISRLSSRLTTLKIQEPSLEDAYVEYLKRTEADAA